ncbi:UDP-galactose transporter [Cokeromyces recurvatus]|uniref:UDP-galactose transporter n=1 Tax=Cokeromyces recurvatus TaxID=90255 RepID=UPI002220BDD2|nr:UDP-galactose transporter [Cokeromyces recurvatus]KAI7897965.1 UDP-galactose transporter [Cokeromyces recurvatus]
MRYTRASVPPDKLYLASTAVLMSEVIKSLVCAFVIYTFLPKSGRSLRRLIAFLYREIVIDWRETIKLALPAILYLIQNNLQYVAATNLDAATFQITYQLKILTTAFFTVIILQRKLSNTKWLALGILTIGIILVVLPKNALQIGWLTVEDESSTSHERHEELNKIGNQSNMIGLMAVLAACILSGIAGVYFEKIVKNSSTNKEVKEEHKLDHLLYGQSEHSIQTELWIRNIQLSVFSVLLGCLFTVGLQDGVIIWEKGFFQNYSPLTWLVILIQAGGGLIVGLVVRYADNILKGFATSISIIISSVISCWLFDFEMTSIFCLGALLVIYATYLYGKS